MKRISFRNAQLETENKKILEENQLLLKNYNELLSKYEKLEKKYRGKLENNRRDLSELEKKGKEWIFQKEKLLNFIQELENKTNMLNNELNEKEGIIKSYRKENSELRDDITKVK